MTPDETLTIDTLSLEDAVSVANKGTHCGMCRFDFLGSGVCPAGKKHGYLAYWPQGRMEIVKHIHNGDLKPTQKLLDIVDSCNLCGICDKQCNFTTQLRPEKVAKALKQYVDTLDRNNIQTTPQDQTVKDLKEIVGEEWATNDPVIITSYIRSIIPVHAELNFYVVLPQNTEEVSKIIKYANKHNISFLPRSGGTALSVVAPTILAKGLSLDNGIIIDLSRLQKLEIDTESETATVGAGITTFELQKEAYYNKFRVLAAEAGAHYCCNIAVTGIISTWGNKYGAFADNFIDLTIVDDEGNIKKHSDLEIDNPYTTEPGFTNLSLAPDKIITEAEVKLHPVFDNEKAVLVPYEDLRDAYRFLIKLARKDIGLSLAVLSRKYLAEFLSPTLQISRDFDFICKNYLKLNYVVSVICTEEDKKIIEDMVDYSFGESFVRTLILGAPRLSTLKDSEFLKILSEEENPLKAIVAGPMKEHFDKAIDPSPEQVANVFDEDLRDFYKGVYSKPEMTDVKWLHAFRILPTRMLRQQMFFGPGGSMLTSDEDHYLKWIQMFSDIGDKYNLEHSMGFISPLDSGKFAYMEYDYFYDHNNSDEANRVSKTTIDTMEQSLVMGKVLTILNYLFKGIYRKEHVLYPIPGGISEEEQTIFKDLLDTILGEG
jgi:heterodisulfide reductase subunit C